MRKIVKGQKGAEISSVANGLSSMGPTAGSLFQSSLGQGLSGNAPIPSGPSFGQKLSLLNTKANNFSNGNIGGIAGANFGNITNFANSALQAFTPQRDNSLYGTEQSIAGAVAQLPGIAGLVGKAMQLNSSIGNALGTSVNSVSKDQAKKAGISGFERGLNNAFGTVANLIGGPTFGALNKLRNNVEFDGPSLMTSSLRGAYTGTLDDMDTASGMGDNILFGRRKANQFKQDAVDRDKLITNLGLDNNERVSSVPVSSQLYDKQRFNKLNGGSQYTAVGKQGMKLLSKEELGKILSSHQEIIKFQNGGSIMIPEGALHAHKHHMEDVNPELAEDLTKKGIPVVVTDSEGNVEQCAEIERSEAIFSSSLTQEVEKLWKENTEDAMIKCGKLVVDALFNDCIDNAGLIESVKE